MELSWEGTPAASSWYTWAVEPGSFADGKLCQLRIEYTLLRVAILLSSISSSLASSHDFNFTISQYLLLSIPDNGINRNDPRWSPSFQARHSTPPNSPELPPLYSYAHEFVDIINAIVTMQIASTAYAQYCACSGPSVKSLIL